MFKVLSRSNDKTALRQISPAELAQMMKQGDHLVVLDVRSPEEYARDGHIAGSRLMPLPTVPVRSNELPHDKPIVCVCRSGARSSAACEALRKQGFENIINMNGGMTAWQRAGLATS
jgi:rhodanese-related sulfurtransferase